MNIEYLILSVFCPHERKAFIGVEYDNNERPY